MKIYKYTKEIVVLLLLAGMAAMFYSSSPSAQEETTGYIDTTPYLHAIQTPQGPIIVPIIIVEPRSAPLIPEANGSYPIKGDLKTERTPNGVVTTGKINGRRIQIESDIPD